MPLIGVKGSQAEALTRAFIRMCRSAGRDAEIAEELTPDAAAKNGTFLIKRVTGGEHDAQAVLLAVSGETGTDGDSLNESACLIVNADDKDALHGLDGLKTRVITFGFNGKACVTASSVADGAIQVCVQRGISTPEGGLSVPCEFSVQHAPDEDASAVLGAAALGVACGIFPVF